MPSSYYIAWWNVENLFDEENSPRRTEKLKRVLGSSILGWTPALRDRKIDQLASVVAQMNGGLGPDLLGVCEVENEFVVARLKDRVNALLPARGYDIVHFDTVDERGIDVAFLFDPHFFSAPPDQRFQYIVMRRTATREILQVNFATHRARTWAVFGNHWPSRSGGTLESAGYRAIAGETLAFFHQRVGEVHGAETPVLAMGDFNDEPFDASLVQYALSTRERAKVVRGTSPRFWNLMWEVLGTGEATFYFDNFANLLDQFLVNKHMLVATSPIRVVPGSAEIVRFPGMFDPAATYQAPIRFGGMGKAREPGRFLRPLPDRRARAGSGLDLARPNGLASQGGERTRPREACTFAYDEVVVDERPAPRFTSSRDPSAHAGAAPSPGSLTFLPYVVCAAAVR